ncbi:hypothetical protein Vafri_5718 [Volvox africanus]|nr:hypothetical protein Vafri_5718 [Volvox africanus]
MFLFTLSVLLVNNVGKEVPYDRIFCELLGDSRRLVPRTAAITPPTTRGLASDAGEGTKEAEGSTATQQPAEFSGVAGEGGGGGVEEYDVPSFRDELEHITSGRFVSAVRSPYGMYGTRSQTVMVIWHDGSGEARERYREGDGSWSELTIPFRLEVG